MGGRAEIERWPTRGPPEVEAETQLSFVFAQPAGKRGFNEPLLSGPELLTLLRGPVVLRSGICWQPLHSPVSSLAANHMFQQPAGDISPLPRAAGTQLIKKKEETRWRRRSATDHADQPQIVAALKEDQIDLTFLEAV